MATYGVIGSPTYAVAIPSLSGMLTVLPDNSANLISAQDVRNVVAGLYEGISGLSSSISLFATSSVNYVNTNLTSVSVGGVSYNSTFTGSTIQQVLDRLFYPYTPPTLLMTVSPNLVEYGNTSQLVTLSYSASAGINNTINSTIYRPLDPSQIVNTPPAFGLTGGLLGSNQILPNTITVFTFSVNDSLNIIETTTEVSYSLRRFWGTLPATSSLVSITSSVFSYSDVSSLSSELFSGYTQSREIYTNNDYVFFVWPSNSINLQSFPPKVLINGISNNDWIKTRDNVEFTNQFGYTFSYDVWRFNNLQGSFTSSYVITT